MPNLDQELDHLAAADRHIERAEYFVAALRNTWRLQRARGLDVTSVEGTLQAALEALDVFVLHRRIIRQVIEDIRAGRLPDD